MWFVNHYYIIPSHCRFSKPCHIAYLPSINLIDQSITQPRSPTCITVVQSESNLCSTKSRYVLQTLQSKLDKPIFWLQTFRTWLVTWILFLTIELIVTLLGIFNWTSWFLGTFLVLIWSVNTISNYKRLNLKTFFSERRKRICTFLGETLLF